MSIIGILTPMFDAVMVDFLLWLDMERGAWLYTPIKKELESNISWMLYNWWWVAVRQEKYPRPITLYFVVLVEICELLTYIPQI